MRWKKTKIGHQQLPATCLAKSVHIYTKGVGTVFGLAIGYVRKQRFRPLVSINPCKCDFSKIQTAAGDHQIQIIQTHVGKVVFSHHVSLEQSPTVIAVPLVSYRVVNATILSAATAVLDLPRCIRSLHNIRRSVVYLKSPGLTCDLLH